MRSVAITNAKGGVGKSTTAINLAAALAEQGRRALLLDADPSGNATLGLFPTGASGPGLAEVLLDGLDPATVARASSVHGLDVIPPGDRLGACSDQMGGSQGLGQGREFRVRRVLRQLAAYDVVLVDTSPVQTPLNVAILYAVDEVLIPIDPCVAALAGVRALEELIAAVSEFRKEFTDAGTLRIGGVLLTRVDRTLVARQVEREVREYFGDLAYERSVPTSVKFREAYARGIPLIDYDPEGSGSLAYREAAAAFWGHNEHDARSSGRGAGVGRTKTSRADATSARAGSGPHQPAPRAAQAGITGPEAVATTASGAGENARSRHQTAAPTEQPMGGPSAQEPRSVRARAERAAGAGEGER